MACKLVTCGVQSLLLFNGIAPQQLRLQAPQCSSIANCPSSPFWYLKGCSWSTKRHARLVLVSLQCCTHYIEKQVLLSERGNQRCKAPNLYFLPTQFWDSGRPLKPLQKQTSYLIQALGEKLW